MGLGDRLSAGFGSLGSSMNPRNTAADLAVIEHNLNEKQKNIAEEIIDKENQKLSGKVVTKLSLLKNYCPAEEYHQKYLEKR